MLAPAASAARATAGFIVSIESATLVWAARRSKTGMTRRSSSASLTGVAPGRVDSPPMSKISAPCATNSSACATAASVLKNFPPSEKESGVTLTTPMTSFGRGKRNSNWRARMIIQKPPSTKAPTSREAPNSQAPSFRTRHVEAWSLKLLWCLDVGAWCFSNFRAEIRNRVGESVGQLHFRLPLQDFPGLGDVGLALFRIVLRQRLEHNFALRLGGLDDFFGELHHRHFARIADVHGQIVVAHHQTINAFDQIRSEEHTSRLRALAKHGH